jgi:hypothetical protein
MMRIKKVFLFIAVALVFQVSLEKLFGVPSGEGGNYVPHEVISQPSYIFVGSTQNPPVAQRGQTVEITWTFEATAGRHREAYYQRESLPNPTDIINWGVPFYGPINAGGTTRFTKTRSYTARGRSTAFWGAEPAWFFDPCDNSRKTSDVRAPSATHNFVLSPAPPNKSKRPDDTSEDLFPGPSPGPLPEPGPKPDPGPEAPPERPDQGEAALTSEVIDPTSFILDPDRGSKPTRSDGYVVINKTDPADLGTVGSNDVNVELTHRIVTINSPAARDLKGTLKLDVEPGSIIGDYVVFHYDSTTGARRTITLPFQMPVTEPGHDGGDVHDFHAGYEQFSFRRIGDGALTLKVTVAPDNGAPFKTSKLHLLPVEVRVDADRDGEITFDQKDKTTAAKPYRFWVNDDRDIENDVDDGDSEEDDVDSFANDCDQPGLEYSRDLEDLTRLWIDFSGISQVFPASDPTVALKVRIQSESGDPRFTFFQPVESDGGKQYLKDEATGSSQLQGSYGQELCRVAGTSSVEIPRRAWETLPSDKVVHLLFEGAKAGDAELIFEIWKDGEKVCDLPTVHIVLKKADDMYETWTVGDVVNEGVDYTKWPASTFSQTTGQDLPAPEKPEEKDYIMLVHGWNMPPWEKETYGSTMFKRMWHQGYKGRFGMFRWPTFHGFEGDFEDLTQDPDHFNASELRAWNSASRLKALIENRAAVFGSDKIRLYAHSMGNIVCGEALRQFGPSGASVHSYIAAQAAISSHAYDKTTPARKPAYQLEMPNVYGYYWQQGASDWPPQWEMDGRPSYMNPQYLPGNVAYINHYNFDDYALNGTRWPLNQDLKPGFNYHYTFQGLVGGYSDYRFIRGPRYNQTILNIPADRYEIFSNAADSAANALGKVGTTGGKFSESVNVAPLLVYDTHPEAHKYHSGQFRSTVQKRWEYWKLALENMKTATPAQ